MERSGSRVGVVGAAVEPSLELPLSLAEAAGELGQLRPAEDEQDDEENDQELRATEAETEGHGLQPNWWAHRRPHGAQQWRPVLECVINISEGRDLAAVETIARAALGELLDVHTDPDHHRSVLTVVGEAAARAITTAAVLRLDLRRHHGVHPRIGVVDVVPFVPLGPATLADAVAARDRFAHWASEELGLPCFLYGPERTLPEIRKGAFGILAPDLGPKRPHPTAGGCAVGARLPMVAYNVWLATDDLEIARGIARGLRGPAVRALGLPTEGRVQVSMNLIDPLTVGPADVYDRVAERAPVTKAELVGLVPRAVLERVDPDRWEQLDLAESRPIEARLQLLGFDSEA